MPSVTNEMTDRQRQLAEEMTKLTAAYGERFLPLYREFQEIEASKAPKHTVLLRKKDLAALGIH